MQDYETKKLSKIQNLIIYFFIFAFLGWVLETFYSLYVLGHFTKRGFLYGPLCPIYGYSAIIMITFFENYKNKTLKLFLKAVIIFSIFEYIAGFMLDALFGIRLWDYTTDFFNLNGRISIFYSFVWGIIAILFVNHLFPYIEKKVNFILTKIPYMFQNITIYIIITIFLLDSFLSILHWK